MNDTYNKDTIDEKFKGVHDRFDVQDNALDKILTQTTKTNGRVNKLERYLLVVGCVTGTLVIVKFPEVFDILSKFI